MGELITINDSNYRQYIDHIDDAGEKKSKGLIPRNFNTHPVGYCSAARPFDLPVVPESKWQAQLDLVNSMKSQLSTIRLTGNAGQPIPSRDQNGKGYCWAHSSTSAALVLRARDGQPYADLSAYAVACMIKNFQDEGGWGSESLEFIASKGIPTSQFWPQQSMSKSNDNANTWANAALHKYTEWMDGAEDKDTARAQMVTAILFYGLPCVTDFSWWSHSVCTLDIVSLNPFKTKIWNSWGNDWSDQGMGDLEGDKAIPDGLVIPRVITAATS